MNRRFWMTWPFLCLLAGLFALSVTAPRAWQKSARVRSGKAGIAQSSRWDAALNAPKPVAPASDRPSLGQDLDVALLAKATVDFAHDGFVLDGIAVSRKRRSLTAFATAAVEPKIVALPASMVTDSEKQTPEVAESGEAEATDAPELPVKRLPEVAMGNCPQPSPLPEGEGTMTRDASGTDLKASEAVWPTPQSLLARLDELAGDSEAGRWAAAVSEQIHLLGNAVATSSDESLMIIERLNELARDADRVGTVLERNANPLCTKLRRTQHALGRRLDIWRRVLLAGGPGREVAAPLDSQRLASSLVEINAILGDSEAGRPWREYLRLVDLEQLGAGAIDDEDSARDVARAVYKRLTQPNLTVQQQQFLAQRPMMRLTSTLEQWLYGSIDLAAVLRHVEQVEAAAHTSDARALSDDYGRLIRSKAPIHRSLAERLQLHYRNANVRVAIAEELLNRMIPERQPQYQVVHDEVMGRPVHGRSTTSTDVAVKLIPDDQRLRLALEIKGLVSALTASTAGPATFYNNSQSTYVARKEIEMTTAGLKLWPAEVAVYNDLYLRSLKTSLDPIPVVGSLVQEVARSQHEQSRPAMSREVERKVAAKAKQQIDDEAGARLGNLSQRLQSRFVEPFAAMSLGPALISAQTTDVRMTARLRFATDEQLGGWTPRPQAPADSLLSIQLHETVFNNIIEQMNLDGGTFTVAQIRQRIAQRFNRPEMLRVETPNDDVVIRFADKDAARIQFQNGSLMVSLSIVSLSRSPHRWKNFQVRAFYRPEWNGKSVDLTRDGVVRLTGERLNTSAQIALRGIFSKTFSKEHPWALMPETLANHPQMANLGITQCVIEDGWIGVALGPARPDSQPVVARRKDGKPDAK